MPDLTATRTFPYSVNATSLADGNHLDIDPANAPGGGPTVLEVTQLVFGGDCDVKFRADIDGDGTNDVEETLDSYTGSGIVTDMAVRLTESDGQTLRVTNTSGSTADFVLNSDIIGGVSG